MRRIPGKSGRFFGAAAFLTAWLLLASAGDGRAFGIMQPAPTLGYEIVDRLPHDPSGFTQGLLFKDGLLYQSDGLYGHSRLTTSDPATGRILHEIKLAPEYFGEGLALAGGRLYQLTWREGKVLVYDAGSLAPVGELPLATEGWGVAYDGKRLIVSDGGATLRFYEPETMRETGRITVTDGGKPVDQLNELEWVDGVLFANVWRQDRLAAIDPKTGKVVSWRDLSGLRRELKLNDPDAVLNGVAFDPGSGVFFVTGKLWPRMFTIKLTDTAQ